MRLFEPVENRRQVGGNLAWFGLWVITTSIGAYLRPNPAGHGTHTQLGFPQCPTVTIFDRPCPGCGLTTSWTATIHGQWGLAQFAHPLGPFLYAVFTLTAMLGLYLWATRQRPAVPQARVDFWIGAAAVVFLVYGIARFFLMPGYAERPGYAPDRSTVDVSATGAGAE